MPETVAGSSNHALWASGFAFSLFERRGEGLAAPRVVEFDIRLLARSTRTPTAQNGPRGAPVRTVFLSGRERRHMPQGFHRADGGPIRQPVETHLLEQGEEDVHPLQARAGPAAEDVGRRESAADHDVRRGSSERATGSG